MRDQDLVQQAREGDLDSFGKLVDRHRGAVHGLAYHWTGSFADAEDIAQEAFVRAYLHLGQLREPDRFAGWLWKLTQNECRQWGRRQRTDTPLEAVEDSLATADPSPTQDLERSEARVLVQRCLRRLSDNNRLVISLHYLGGLSYREIAQFLDLSANAVAARLHRARKELEVRLMDTIGDSLRDERLDDDFSRKVLEQAKKRARESQDQWQGEAFAVSVEQGLEAARQLQDTRAQIEMLSMLGAAGASWLGDADRAAQSYEAALAIAKQSGDKVEEARLLGCLYKAHLRRGEWQRVRACAEEAIEACQGTADLPGQTQAQAALDLAESLPGLWRPGEAGGYAAAAFPCTLDGEGYRWGDPVAERRYSWGCPSRCAALMHLYRPRRFLGPSLEVGTRWEDRVEPGRDGMSWSTDAGEPEPIARSRVRDREAVAVTPAGRFEGCLEVHTAIAGPGGGTAAELSMRSYCGERTAWYGPGVGLVKLRHEDQNGGIWVVRLVACEGSGGNGYFPLEAGCWWRYRWTEWPNDTALFEDLCRVVAAADGVAWIASATWARERSPEEVRTHLEEQVELERAGGDLAGEATALEGLLVGELGEARAATCRQEVLGVYERRLAAAEVAGDLGGQRQALDGMARHCSDPERMRACYEQVASLCETIGDAWGALSASQSLREHTEELAPEESAGMARERLELARRLGDREKERDLLKELAECELQSGSRQEASLLFEEYAQVVVQSGDVTKVAQGIAQAELARALGQDPEGEICAWWTGTGRLREKEGGLECPGSARHPWREGQDLEGWSTPMTDIFQLDPLMGIDLLDGEAGQSRTGGLSTSLASRPGYCESMRCTATLESVDDEVEVPAGAFAGCARIGVTISTSSEERPVGEQAIEEELGYHAGTKKVWYAPGVGLVKLTYRHQNGSTTEVELLEYELAQGDDSWMPLAIDNRWRYGWTEAAGDTRFEDLLRVAAHRNGQWSIAFVTRTKASPS